MESEKSEKTVESEKRGESLEIECQQTGKENDTVTEATARQNTSGGAPGDNSAPGNSSVPGDSGDNRTSSDDSVVVKGTGGGKEEEKAVKPRDTGAHKPLAMRDPYRHAHYQGHPLYSYPPHPSQIHNGYPGNEADLYHYHPHMYSVPPGYGMRQPPHTQPAKKTQQNSRTEKEKGLSPVGTPNDDGQGIPLAQRMTRNERGFPPGYYGMPPHDGFPAGYGPRMSETEVSWPMDSDPSGYSLWHRPHGYPAGECVAVTICDHHSFSLRPNCDGAERAVESEALITTYHNATPSHGTTSTGANQ